MDIRRNHFTLFVSLAVVAILAFAAGYFANYNQNLILPPFIVVFAILVVWQLADLIIFSIRDRQPLRQIPSWATPLRLNTQQNYRTCKWTQIARPDGDFQSLAPGVVAVYILPFDEPIKVHTKSAKIIDSDSIYSIETDQPIVVKSISDSNRISLKSIGQNSLIVIQTIEDEVHRY